ncbi:hypothetical protein [Candidatus Nitrosocosmicus hydrocola]|uniref:hypothetical protein n=1 Tax=Candidatus Nitrosocosmicus hydrocola TaxID=1826872 RepID=UPI0011E5DDAB|nr:hypothetical protein [Candidatus Nitrosocosmicus hydrocola]
MEESKPVSYYIPNPDDDPTNERITRITNKIKIEDLIERSKRIKGCKVFQLEGRFVNLFNEAYQAYILGMDYTTVSLCALASERLCYDLIESSKITFDGRIISNIEKESFYRIPFSELVFFSKSIGLLPDKVAGKMMKLNNMRNVYIHPSFKRDRSDPEKLQIKPESDSVTALNNLIDIISGFGK